MFGRDRAGDPERRREELVDRLAEAGHIEGDATAEAMRSVPRHEFVSEERRDAAYADRPLHIGAGQTISAPHMVAVVCDLLDVGADDRVLEVGTGCGYHAAVTAELADDVYSIECVDRLAESARRRLQSLSYDAVDVRVGDGRHGWPTHAPYDAAYLTCAAPSLPDTVVDQLRTGGRLVAPVGTDDQRLVAATRTADGLDREDHGAVRFVRMQGGD